MGRREGDRGCLLIIIVINMLLSTPRMGDLMGRSEIAEVNLCYCPFLCNSSRKSLKIKAAA